MKPIHITAALMFTLAAANAAASSDTCIDWCGERPSAYFLAPMNDTRSNLGLLLEDLGVVSYPGDVLPFHYEAFLKKAEETQVTGDLTQATEVPLEVTKLAVKLGVAPEVVAAAEGRMAYGFYGRCISDGPTALGGFFNAVLVAGLSQADQAILASERLRMVGLCDKAGTAMTSLPVSGAAQPFARYLAAAGAFYGGQFDKARAMLEGLKGADSPWLRETALYLLGRVSLNQAQVPFDDWGEPGEKNIDRAYIGRAVKEFEVYLKAYPEGRYASSARGLFRKLRWLSADRPALATEYQRLILRLSSAKNSEVAALRLLNETESKLNPAERSSEGLWPAPALAAVAALASLRSGYDSQRNFTGASGDPVAASLPVTHRADFAAAGLDGLGEYLALSRRYWVDKDYAGVIKATEGEPATASGSTRTFSRCVLRGLALTASGRLSEAETLWRGMIAAETHPGRRLQAQWLLAITWQIAGRLNALYARGSPAGEASIRLFAIHRAPPSLQERLAARADLPKSLRAQAYFHLVNGLLRHRQFKEAARVLRKRPKDLPLKAMPGGALSWQGSNEYGCPPLPRLVAQLNRRNPRPFALNCMGDFLREVGWNESPLSVVGDNEFSEAGQMWHRPQDYGLPAAAGWAVPEVTSLDYYLEVINRHGKVTANDVAYALHRAITCFASSGYNHCGQQNIPASTRAVWFRRLKSRFGNISWAKGQKYYW